jgi:hypothetical protein
MSPAAAIQPKQIRKIKVLSRRVFGADDEGYRDMLRGLTGGQAASCKDLRGAQIDLVIKHLERCLGQGAPSPQPSPPQGRGGEGPQAGTPVPLDARPTGTSGPPRATASQLKEIQRLWGRVSRAAQEFGPESHQASWALDKWLYRRFQVGALGWLTLTDGQKVIQALKAMERRQVR